MAKHQTAVEQETDEGYIGDFELGTIYLNKFQTLVWTGGELTKANSDKFELALSDWLDRTRVLRDTSRIVEWVARLKIEQL